MTKIIWMSDPHFQSEGTIGRLNPRMRLGAAIEHANTYHSDADFIILSGDLVGGGSKGDYVVMASYLAKSNIPIHPMMGNHDKRDGLRNGLKLPANVMPDFVQYSLETPDSIIICLDTHKIGSDAGQLCEARQTWLDVALTKAANKHAYIFMHHPPLALELPRLDEIMLEEDEAFLNLIAGHSNVKHLFMGHVHRALCGTVNGFPFSTLPALSFQAPAPRPAWEWETFKAAEEAPQYGVLFIENGNVVLQYTQFCAYEVGIET